MNRNVDSLPFVSMEESYCHTYMLLEPESYCCSLTVLSTVAGTAVSRGSSEILPCYLRTMTLCLLLLSELIVLVSYLLYPGDGDPRPSLGSAHNASFRADLETEAVVFSLIYGNGHC